MNYDILQTIIAMIPDLAKGIISLFIIVDPVGNVPISIGLTESMSETDRRKAFHTAVITGFLLLLAFAISGQRILTFFGISVPSFMIAGGALLLIISVRILIVGGWREFEVSPESIGAVPIGFPLLVGPGAITTTILNLQTIGLIPTVLSVLIIFAMVWVILRFIDMIYHFLGKTGSMVIARVMAMFIAAIAVQYILQGIRYTFH